ADSTPTNPMMENAKSWALNVAITASRLLRLPARLDHGGAAGLPLGDTALGSLRQLLLEDPVERRLVELDLDAFRLGALHRGRRRLLPRRGHVRRGLLGG